MKGKIALITGANRGLGRNAAMKLAERGVNIVATYRNNAAEADALVAEIVAAGGKAQALRLDVAQSETFREFAAEVAALLKRDFQRDTFDFLVNNAGVGLHVAFAETTPAQFDDMMAVHLKGPFFLTQALLPLIADNGRILNVSSGLTRFSLPGSSAYATMKGGIEVLTRYLARELGGRGIAVNTIAPGAIATDFSGGVVRDNPEVNRFVSQNTALGRAGLPDDIGGAIAGLLSDENRWMTAQRVEFSGGMFI
jgi:NAD(P)-dependent dehydrogenase (short-subunit alcohol dehydrogenase family)